MKLSRVGTVCFCSITQGYRYIKHIFLVKIQHFATAKPDKDPNSGSALVWLPGSGFASKEKLDPELGQKPMRIHKFTPPAQDCFVRFQWNIILFLVFYLSRNRDCGTETLLDSIVINKHTYVQYSKLPFILIPHFSRFTLFLRELVVRKTHFVPVILLSSAILSLLLRISLGFPCP